MREAVKSPYFWAEDVAEALKGYVPASGQPDHVDVVMASDKGFLPYTAVTFSTILANYSDARRLRLHLLTDAVLEPKDREYFDDLQRIHPFWLNIIPVDGSIYEGLRTTPGISVATYYRLQMHDLLPSDVSRVVYLDADIVVRDCVSKLYDFALDGAIMAGVEDTISNDYIVKLSQHPGTRHVNAGVLLIDIDALRYLQFHKWATAFLRAKRYTLMLGDQEILTGLLGLKTAAAPITWNVHGSMFEREWVERVIGTKNNMDPEEARTAIADPALIHYTYKRKPWIAKDHPRAADWYKAAAQTAYRFDLGV